MADGLSLGFDTSAAHCAAALVSGTRILAARHEEMTKGQAERLSPLVYLRETPMTKADAGIVDFARSIPEGPTLNRMHQLMGALKDTVAFEVGSTSASHTAADAFAQKRGVCQDHSQIFISAARLLGVPARYVSGHLSRQDGRHDQDAAHAWAEIHVGSLGWVGFDAANACCPDDRYVRLGSGLDAQDAAPVRGMAFGQGVEALAVRVHVEEVPPGPGQAQAQSQGQGESPSQDQAQWQDQQSGQRQQ